MELFLLLSIGLSIVAFISIALNQAPPIPAVRLHHQPEAETKADEYVFVHSGLEPAFPLESVVRTPQKMNVLKLKDQVVLQDFKSLDTSEVLADLPESALQKKLPLAVSE